jgi:hypothetical protein
VVRQLHWILQCSAKLKHDCVSAVWNAKASLLMGGGPRDLGRTSVLSPKAYLRGAPPRCAQYRPLLVVVIGVGRPGGVCSDRTAQSRNSRPTNEHEP